jgi:uncharacterized membrane protein YbaN (DUF454 family)
MEPEAGGAVAAITSLEEEFDVARSAVARFIYGTLGFIFLGVGVAGFYLPVLPGTVNLLVAAYFFSMSSRRMYRWMLTNNFFGQELRDYKAGLGLPRRVKAVAVASIVLSVGLSVGVILDNPWAQGGMALFGLIGIGFILNQPTREIELARRESAVRSSEATG